jgi:sugar phosphate isomerase/epimerase
MNSKPFPLGLFSYIGYELPLHKRLELIARAGFDATSVWWGEEEEICRRGMHRQAAEMVRDRGLFLEFVHVPYQECNAFWSENASDRDRAVAQHLAWVQDCAELGIPMMVMHPARGSYEGPINKHGVESIARIVSAAEDARVVIAIENTRRMDCIDPIFSDIESPNLGFCYDSSHERLCTEDTGILLRRLGDRLRTTHLSDNDGLYDHHWLPGEGVIDWLAIADAFPAKNYTGCFTLEVVPGKLAKTTTPAEFLAEAFTRANQLAGMIFDDHAPKGES